ncbi:CsbA family protein [Fredinandcohnia humi]
MLLKFVLALILPGLLVILFTRVTYNHYVGLLLAAALMVVSIYKGFTHTTFIAIVDIISLAAGFWYAKGMGKRARS